MSSQLATLKGKIYEARNYLNATDYIVIKLAEALLNGEDLSELKTTYAEQLVKRKEYRASIDALQVEINALNEKLKASEEAKNDESIEDVIEQPVEEIPTDTSEVVEEIPTEINTSEQPTNIPTEKVTEVDTTDQTSDNITNITNTTGTNESIEEQPIDTPTEETPITDTIMK